MGTDEKIILLAALFREIGKFAQLCGVEKNEEYIDFSSNLAATQKELLQKILGVECENGSSSEDYLKKFLRITSPPTEEDNNDNLSKALRLALSLALGDNDSPAIELNSETSSFLTSIFQTIQLSAENYPDVKYIKHEVLSESNLHLIDADEIKTSLSTSNQTTSEENTKEENSTKAVRFSQKDYDKFIKDLNTILESYEEIDNFPSFYNLLLNHFEHYFWCLPVDNNPEHTGISLFNYVKDVAGLAHAIYQTPNSKNLLLINVELVGKVKYMSNIVNTKPAKILRGRSIFVQVVTRIVVSILLKDLGLTDASIVMHAAGKILIVAPGDLVNSDKIAKVTKTIEETLKKNFLYEISFGIGVTEFPKAPVGEWSFGDVVEASNIQQQNKWQKLFYDDLIKSKDKEKFVLKGHYYKPSGDEESDKMKCQVTGMPIIEGRERKIPQRYEEDGKWVESEITVDLQVSNEFKIGDIVPKDTIVIGVDQDSSDEWFNVREPKKIKEFSGSQNFKIIINPEHDALIGELKTNAKLLKDASFLHVANYVTMMPDAEPDDEEMVPDEKKKTVMDFETMTKRNIGGEFLTMIKGDIDNFGIILSCGLKNHSVSSHSTLSSQLKYFFSFGLNKLLSEWCGDEGKDDKVVYCIYSGGDDIFFVTTQSYAIELVRDLNKKFIEFTCSNPEIHISYSFTNFKHNTPIRIISDFADNNQKAIKKIFKGKSLEPLEKLPVDYFWESKNKAGSMIFDTPVKNNRLDEIIRWTELLTKWIELEDNPPLTKGAIRYIFDLSKMMTNYFNGDSKSLIWHPKLTYYVKRNIKPGHKFTDPVEAAEFKKFIKEILEINSSQRSEIQEILTPVTSAVVLRTRN